MKRSIGVVCTLLIALVAWPSAAPAQTALERLESRLRQQSRGEAKPDAQAPGQNVQAAPVVAPPQPQPPSSDVPVAKAGGQGWLGVVADDENDRGRGVRVLEVTPDGPAAKAGFRVQDLITAVANIRVRQMSDLADMLGMYKPGDAVSFEVERDGKPQKLQATLGQHPGQRTTEAPAVPAAVPKPEEPLLLPPQAPPPALPAKTQSAAPDDRSRVAVLEQRVRQLERRVEELERALRESRQPK